MEIKVLKKRFLVSIFVFSLLVTPLLISAAVERPEDVQRIIEDVVRWFMNIFWVIAVGFIVWAAFHFLTAQGDVEKVQKAKKMLLYAVIAAAIVLLANGVKVILTNIIAGQGFQPSSTTGQCRNHSDCPDNPGFIKQCQQGQCVYIPEN